MPIPESDVRTSSVSKPSPTRLRWMVTLLLLAGGVAGFALLLRPPARAKLPPAKAQPVRTKVVELAPRDFPVLLRAQGVVRAREETTLSAQVSGRVLRVSERFDDGAFFAAGEVLVEVEDEDYRTAVAMAEARLRSAEAAYQLAQVSQRRNAEMLKEKLLPEAEAQATEASLSQARAEANVAAAQLERARRDLERTRVRAPFNGCVRRRTVGTGQLLGPGTSLGAIFSVDAAEVRLPVAGRDLVHLFPSGLSGGEPIRVELRDAVNRDSPARWEGRVVRTEGALDENSLDLFVIVQVGDPFGRVSGKPPLRPGQPVAGVLRGRVLTHVVALPRAAVRELDRVILVHREKRTLASHRIVPVWADEDHVVVDAGGLPPDHLLATTHLVYAPEGSTVEIIPEAVGGAAKAGQPTKGATP